MKKLSIKTPLIKSEIYKKSSGSVFLKLENLQPTGSFKIRGLGHFCQEAVKNGAQHFVSSSGGNAGLAVAYAARKLGVSATVIVPETTSLWAQQKIKDQHARVVVHGKNWGFADDYARKLAEENRYVYVSPFDHPDIFSGYRSIAHELKKQCEKPSALLVAVGGGGLLSGVIQGLREIGWNDVRVYAAETNGAASFRAAIKAGQPVDIGAINTIAVTLGAPEICAQAYLESCHHPTISKVVSDEQALHATINFANHHRMLVEVSCGAALSLLEHDADVQKEESVVAIICGGTGVNLKLIRDWERKLGL